MYLFVKFVIIYGQNLIKHVNIYKVRLTSYSYQRLISRIIKNNSDDI